jgi:hypothetical protein
MQKLLLTLTAFGVFAAPALAQTAPNTSAVPADPATSTASTPAPIAKPKTVTKIVCERVDVEATSGSRLSSAPKICKKVEVPVTNEARNAPAPPQVGNNDRH